MPRSLLYRVSKGDVDLVPSAIAAVVPGHFDETNWGTDWMLFTARSGTEALRIARCYDAALNAGRIKQPPYLKSLSSGWEQMHKCYIKGGK